MKKFVLVLLAVALVGAMAFAQDAAKPTVTFTGKVETGVQINPDKMTAVLHDDDSGTNSRIDLDVKATLGNFELGYYLRSDSLAAVSVPNFWAGYTFLDGKVILRGGKTDAGTTGTVNKGWGDGINTNGGIQLIVAPIAGLQIGGSVGNLSATSAAVADTLEKPAVGLAYAIPNIGDLRINYESFLKLFTAGFNYTGMANLTAQVEGYAIMDKTNNMEAFENVAYAMGAFKPILGLYEGTAKSTALAFKINPEVDYTVSPVVLVGVSGTYVKNGDAGVWKDITPDYYADGVTSLGNTSSYSVSPFIQFNFNSLASCLRIWYDTGDLANTDVSNGKIEINFRSFF